MASVQTKIPFVERKKTAARMSGFGKENRALSSSPVNDENLCLSPKRSLSGGEGSPPKLARKLPLSPCSVIQAISLSPSKKNDQQVESKCSSEVPFTTARRLLHCSIPDRLPMREDKLNEISTIVTKSLDTNQSSTIYISGPPGTGKTACLSNLIKMTEIQKGFDVVYVNCTGVKSSSAVYARIVESLKLKTKGSTEKVCLAAIKKHLSSKHKMILLILDEMDQLESKKQSILYTIFEWPSLPKSGIVLIGIANALDLTDRVLPRLQARLELQPLLIHFPSYTKEEIIEVLKDRLSDLTENNVLPGPALQLLASKVAAVSGDMRKALDIARRVIEMAQLKKSSAVSLPDVLKVVNNVYGTAQTIVANDAEEASESFPLQQKLLICTVLLIIKNAKSKDMTVGKVHDIYKKVCAKRNLSSVDLSEFLSISQLVESRGIIRIHGKTQNRLSKVSLQWDEKEVTSALQDKQLLASVLSDVSCLPGPK